MTYHTPELLLIGAAQNFVLSDPKLSPEFQACDDDTIFYAVGAGPDSNNW